MAYDDQVYHLTDGAYIKYGAHRFKGVKNLENLTTGGNATQIDITGLGGRAKEYAMGKIDPPTLSATANAAFQSPLFTALQTNNRRGISETLYVVLGNVPENAGTTDGTPTLLRSNEFNSAGATGESLTTMTTTHVTNYGGGTSGNVGLFLSQDTASKRLPGISEGDFIQVDSGSLTKALEITNIRTNASGDVLFETADTTAATSVTTGNYTFWKPAIMITCQVFVMQYGFGLNPDAVAELSIELQVTGEPILDVGGKGTSGSEPAAIELP